MGDASTEGRGHTALVTGASSGIGRSFAQLLAAKGYDVVVVARRKDRLIELRDQLELQYRVKVHPLVCDLSQDGSATEIRRNLEKNELFVDFLVNNAGYTLRGDYLDNQWDDEFEFIRLMALTPAELCRYLVPGMVQAGWGRVVNVTSVGGAMPGTPGMALYGATKSFVHKLTEGLAAEYESQGVHCTVSVPGSTDTEVFVASGISDAIGKSPFLQLTLMSPDAVARQAYRACMANRRVIVHGWPNKSWVFTLSHSPARIRYRLVMWIPAVEPDSPNASGS